MQANSVTHYPLDSIISPAKDFRLLYPLDSTVLWTAFAGGGAVRMAGRGRPGGRRGDGRQRRVSLWRPPRVQVRQCRWYAQAPSFVQLHFVEVLHMNPSMFHFGLQQFQA